MTFTESISTCLNKYATFDGVASRSEYWWFVLACWIASLLVGLVSNNLALVVNLATIVPSLAAGSRRLHDTGRSGWWQLLGLVPVIGWIVLIVFMAQEGKPNRYDASRAQA